MNIVTIHQPEAFPWLGYFQKMIMADTYVLLDDAQFEKNNWQNRNKMLFANGKEDYITIPVSFKYGDLIKDVQIVDDHWKRKLLARITQDYKKSEGYDMVMEILNKIVDIQSLYLMDYTTNFIYEIRKLLHISNEIKFSSELGLTSKSTQRLVDICKAFGAKTYIAGAGGKNYLDESLFGDINVIYQDYHPENRYSIIYNLLVHGYTKTCQMIGA